MRKHKVKITATSLDIDLGLFGLPGRRRFQERLLENLAAFDTEHYTYDDICELVYDTHDDILDEMDAESIPYRLPQK